jgi:uncharacterized DUF497 family protein
MRRAGDAIEVAMQREAGVGMVLEQEAQLLRKEIVQGADLRQHARDDRPRRPRTRCLSRVISRMISADSVWSPARRLSGILSIPSGRHEGGALLFEFDDAKSRCNKLKHDIGFVEAQALWLDEMQIEIPARTEDEMRFVVIGRIDGKHWSAVMTYRRDRVRIISARRSRDEEVALYEGA